MSLKIEFHAHTKYSQDSLARPEDILKACVKKKIDRIAITDHNTIQGALHAYRLDPQRVIIGEEIQTDAGELLAFFVQEEVPPDLPYLEAIRRLRNQDAFISVSHPYDVYRRGHWDPDVLEEIAPLVDAIEVFNARCLMESFNHQAQYFAVQRKLAGTVGSDAHTLFELGRAMMVLEDFHSAETLRQVIKHGIFNVRLSPGWVHLFSRYAKWMKNSNRFLCKNRKKKRTFH
mgnify:CR=1 FL=1